MSSANGALQINLVLPAGGHIAVKDVFATYLGARGARLADFASLPQGELGQRLMALRYIIANGEPWSKHFVWKGPLSQILGDAAQDGIAVIESLIPRIRQLKEQLAAKTNSFDRAWIEALFESERKLFRKIDDEKTLGTLVALDLFPELRREARKALNERAGELFNRSPELLDLLYLSTVELNSYPATTVTAGRHKYVIIADKGEMGVRAVRETIAAGKTPVTLYSIQDDSNSLQVRLTNKHGGFVVGLKGNFRESYANYVQITERVHEEFRSRFGSKWEDELACAALYPGYGPLAENAAAIRHFRRNGIVFIGPMQDVVENAGDKREFRQVAQRLDPAAVTPGIIIDSSDPAQIQSLIERGYKRGDFAFPGRVKAANGGGGRGQAVVASIEALPQAIQKVLGEIQSYGWDPGVMFEQNIPETIHLEVQILRDRYGNARHFGMRDCSEQRASQKIQEEAPPALLVGNNELRSRIESLAVQIANEVGYVGAGTIELMYKEGSFYFLEMNTRIQVEHPVTEASHRIRRGKKHEPLNLVAWQLRIAEGRAIDFEQNQIECTHVAREFRINAESWHAALKDSRDGKKGLFVPNAGVFDEIEVPEASRFKGYEDLLVRFDCGFEPGDTLVNKDPTFGKLIIAVRPKGEEFPYETLRRACIEVLKELRITGRQVLPDGKVIKDSEFKTNILDHVRILEAEVLRRHSKYDETGRHVNWVVNSLRGT